MGILRYKPRKVPDICKYHVFVCLVRVFENYQATFVYLFTKVASHPQHVALSTCLRASGCRGQISCRQRCNIGNMDPISEVAACSLSVGCNLCKIKMYLLNLCRYQGLLDVPLQCSVHLRRPLVLLVHQWIHQWIRHQGSLPMPCKLSHLFLCTTVFLKHHIYDNT